MGRYKNTKAKAEFTEQRNLQVTLLRSMAFGERDWIVFCVVMFLISAEREFFSFAGMGVSLTGMFFLAPVFGMFIYMLTKMIYFRCKAKHKKFSLRKATWIAHLWCFPFMLGVSWLTFELFYEICNDLTSMSLF